VFRDVRKPITGAGSIATLSLTKGNKKSYPKEQPFMNIDMTLA